MQLNWRALEGEVERLLNGLPGLAVDREQVESFCRRIASGDCGPESNRLSEPPGLLESGDLDQLATLGEAERLAHIETGRRALARGEVAVAVLNGGMATRFGGSVKGIVEVFPGLSFLELKHQQARRYGPVPLLVMNSFATQRATVRFLAQRGLEQDTLAFLQSVSIRLTPEGEIFRDARGALSLYAPGHGDFARALRDSGHLGKLADRGVRALALSNVDNLGAELDPLIVGYHLAHGRALTVELAEAKPGDVGGAPARVAGRPRIVEGFCFPRDFDARRIGFLNTNTFMISLSALERDHPLTWYYVEKTVEGRPAVQMERLVGELSAFVETAYLVTPRDGPRGRFYPVKSPEDLDALRSDPALERRFRGL